MQLIFQLLSILLLLHCSSWKVKSITPEQQVTTPGDYEVKFSIDSRQRIVEFHYPETAQNHTHPPLVILLHGGGGGKVKRFKETTGMQKLADKKGFILAFPYGNGVFSRRLLTWNAGNCCGYAKKNKIDDVKFINAWIEYAKDKLGVDKRRIYVAGISNGGMMAFHIACRLSDKVAAVASISGAFNEDKTTCKPQQPVSILSFRGRLDTHIKYNGGASEGVDKGRIDKSAQHTLNFWQKANRCSTAPPKISSTKYVKQTSYQNCKQQNEVTLYSLARGTHSWPGGKRSAFFLDTPTQDINASQVTWEFFSKHPKKF
ncbi:MAG: alpha/beta fold hydrolase [Spirochaetota bacterium]